VVSLIGETKEIGLKRGWGWVGDIFGAFSWTCACVCVDIELLVLDLW